MMYFMNVYNEYILRTLGDYTGMCKSSSRLTARIKVPFDLKLPLTHLWEVRKWRKKKGNAVPTC